MLKWDEIIGQQKAKDRLQFHLDGFGSGEALPSIMLCAPRGFGKTTLGEATGMRIKEMTGGVKRFYSLNCASVKNLKQFWLTIVVKLIHDRDVTILFDEASELPKDVTMAMLSIINPNPQHKNNYTYDEMTVEFDLKRQTFLFATTEPHKIFHALMNRCRRIDLEYYTYGELGSILKKNSKGIHFGPQVVEYITPTLRGAARQAVMMADDIKTYLSPLKRTEFTMEDWSKLSHKLGVLPLGLNELELKVLRTLQERTNCSLTRIAASLGMTPTSVQKDLELYLQKCNLIEIQPTTGRNLTARGWEYLKQYDATLTKRN